MAEQVLMLALSPTMEEGTIVSWHKKVGDSVAQSDIICEVETDKATMEYESVNEGTLLKILVPDGGKAKVGDPIAVVGESGEDISGLVEAAKSGTEEKAAAAPEAESEPAPKPAAEAKPAAGARQEGAPEGAAPTQRAVQPAPTAGLKASPLARKMASEQGIDLRTVRGSGPGGRIVKRDMEKALRRAASYGPAAAVGIAGPAYTPAAAGPTASGRDEQVPVSGKRKIIAKRLSESKYSAPHYYLRIDVDAGPMMAARARLNARLPKEAGGKVSPNAFLIKLVAQTLKSYPSVNASWQGDTILHFGKIDIALAVAQEDGLITPVVRDCGSKGIVQIDRELKVLIDKALKNKLAPEEYNGATFTISSLGTSGILEFTAIINPPGSAILAVGRIHKAPAAVSYTHLRAHET